MHLKKALNAKIIFRERQVPQGKTAMFLSEKNEYVPQNIVLYPKNH